MGAILSSSARRLDAVSSNDLFSMEVRRLWVKCGSKDMLRRVERMKMASWVRVSLLWNPSNV